MAGDMVFTSESVTEGHPTRSPTRSPTRCWMPCSRTIRWAGWRARPWSRRASSLVAGEISTSATLDIPQIARGVVREIGYTSSEYGFDADTCAVNVALDKQSPDIAQGVDAALEARATAAMRSTASARATRG